MRDVWKAQFGEFRALMASRGRPIHSVTEDGGPRQDPNTAAIWQAQQAGYEEAMRGFRTQQGMGFGMGIGSGFGFGGFGGFGYGNQMGLQNPMMGYSGAPPIGGFGTVRSLHIGTMNYSGAPSNAPVAPVGGPGNRKPPNDNRSKYGKLLEGPKGSKGDKFIEKKVEKDDRKPVES